MRFISILQTLWAASIPLVSFAEVVNLSQLQWTLKNQNGSIAIPATVPSQVHIDLHRAGIITEPLLGINDFTQRWVINDNWTYTADLSPLTKGLTRSHKALLVFYGIDTIANISVAGHPVAWVDNQFRQYVYDISSLIESPIGHTNVTVSLESAYHYGLNVTSRPDAEISPTGDFEYNAIRQFVRKTQSDFGWDWGPAFVPSGIFKPAYFVLLSENPKSSDTSIATHPLLASSSKDASLFIEESSLEIAKVGQTPIAPPNESADWVVNITLLLRSATAVKSPFITVSIPELRVQSQRLPIKDLPASTTEPTLVNTHFTIPNKLPQRWFPHNLGTPKLYNITTTIHLSKTSSVSFQTRSGFRTITLVQSPYSSAEVSRGITAGDQWHFEINGRAFYSSGTNIIPFDPFYARIDSKQVRWILESAVLSGQNMLRVWGGGIYQPSDELTGGYDFYSACDELGLLAWSELIFSDALYPINDFLLQTIEPEVRQNVRRINKHPSNAQWAGGNEIEGIVISVNDTLANGTHYLNEFVTLFQNFLHDIVSEETRSVAYTDCSTTSGVLSLDPLVVRFANKTPGEIYGNGERYNYDASQAFNYSTYPVSRFVNEFGFHSMPSFFSWEEVLESPSDFSFNSTVVASRDHHPPAGNLSFPNPNAPQGQFQMTSAVSLWLPAPPLDNSTTALSVPRTLVAQTAQQNKTFAQWCYSTQVFQSLNMVSEIAWYRRGAGLGENNLGALVWQLNDIWQGVSWSSIEFSGRWKVLNYGMADIFSPIAVFPFWTPTNETLEVRVLSDRWETVHADLEMKWFDWKGKSLGTLRKQVTVPSLNSTVAFARTGLKNILPKGVNAGDAFMRLRVTGKVDGKSTVSEQYFTPTSLAVANLVDPQVLLTHKTGLTFTVSAKEGVAAWAWIDHPAGTVGYFADTSTGLPSNGFFLIPGEDRTVRFVPNRLLSKDAAPNPKDFVVRTLWDNTH
ncbi:glycoside hydrolase family 2 protein [Cristinia sonorae]|uniref:Beta-mannosidase A n=1 Tax=Cristinia sonorae TaxID=1940300 RepID=A0A8K0XKC8_9AGAR|nr:glycoside hydrolase family 2 protein [Cristinia sonorae]